MVKTTNEKVKVRTQSTKLIVKRVRYYLLVLMLI